MTQNIDAGSIRVLLDSYLERFNTPGGCVNLGSRDSIVIVGDIHGSLHNLEKAVEAWVESGADKIVFLGDYVDRGPNGLEVITRLIELRLSEPSRVILLRGNHESASMNSIYGFADEVYSKIPHSEARELMRLILDFYTTLDWIATTHDMLLVHGGIPCRECVGGEPASIEDVCKAVEESGPVKDTVYGIHPILMQLVWNDPRGNIEWFHPSSRGEGVYYYGLKAWLSFMKSHGIKLILRGHEVVDAFSIWTREGGFVEGSNAASILGSSTIDDLEGSVITVFTSSYHHGSSGVLIFIDSVFEPVITR